MRENDDIAQSIAEAGSEWAATQWRMEDMSAYMFRLYLEWDRLLSPARSKHNYVHDAEDRAKGAKRGRGKRQT